MRLRSPLVALLAALPLVAFVACASGTTSSEPEGAAEEAEPLTVFPIPITIILGEGGIDTDIRTSWERECAPDSPASYPRIYSVTPRAGKSCTTFTTSLGTTWTYYGSTLSFPRDLDQQKEFCVYGWKSSSPIPDGPALEAIAAKDAHGVPLIHAACGTKKRGTPKSDYTPKWELLSAGMMAGCPKCAVTVGNTLIVPNTDVLPKGQPLRVALSSGGPGDAGPDADTNVVDFQLGSSDNTTVQVSVTGNVVPAPLKDKTQPLGIADMADGGVP